MCIRDSSGPASLATAGSGDVLAGILAGTLATMRDEMDRWELLYSYAVALHSYAGFAAATEYGEKSVIATDLILSLIHICIRADIEPFEMV